MQASWRAAAGGFSHFRIYKGTQVGPIHASRAAGILRNAHQLPLCTNRRIT